MEALEILQKKLSDTYEELELSFYLEEVKQKILNYCHIDEVPEALNFTWANMARDLICYDDQLKTKDVEVVGPISSIKEGDTQISYSGDVTRNRQEVLDGLILDYKSDLNVYRKLLW